MDRFAEMTTVHSSLVVVNLLEELVGRIHDAVSACGPRTLDAVNAPRHRNTTHVSQPGGAHIAHRVNDDDVVGQGDG